MPGPLDRALFVGRERELLQLRAAFGQAEAGQGSLIMVVGEPGIGKTMLCDQLMTYVAQYGGRTLIGHCYEEGSLALPYLPFVEALGAYVRAHETASLVQELDSDAVELARILPELRIAVPAGLPPSAVADPQESQYRLLQAVGTLLERASVAEPILLVLEDLQDADHGTLTLLHHLTHRLPRIRLLLVGTYRDVEVDRGHPLSSALAAIRRVVPFDRFHLQGLGPREVQQLLEGVTGHTVSVKLAGAVHWQTEGNPLFVREVGRYLLEEESLQAAGSEQLGGDEIRLVSRIPEGLRDVIGRRLGGLSGDCNRLLSAAAVIGHDFRFDTLQAVAETSDKDLAAGLLEAVKLHVLEESTLPGAGAISYRFTHAFFRQMLYGELIAPIRLRLHQWVARTLEGQYAGQLGEHAAELADHFAQSTEAAELLKAVAFGELAAERARAVYAYSDGAAYLERALAVQKLAAPAETARCCDLLLALGEALILAGEPLRAAEVVAPEALALAEALRDQGRASRACQFALEGLWRQRGSAAFGSHELGDWLERADRYAAPGSSDRVRTDTYLTWHERHQARQEAAWEFARRALTLASTLDDDEALYMAARAVLTVGVVAHQDERLRVAREFRDRLQGQASSGTFGYLLLHLCWAFIAHGLRSEAEDASARLTQLAEKAKVPGLVVSALGRELTFVVLDGDLEEAVDRASRLRRLGAELGAPGLADQQAFQVSLRPFCYTGRAEAALAGLTEEVRKVVTDRGSLVFAAEPILCLAHLERWDEIRDLLARLARRLRDAEPGFEMSYVVLTCYLETAVLAGDRDLAALIQARLRGVAGLIEERHLTCIARHLGAASFLLGDREGAYTYYQQALEVAGRVRFRPEIALIHLQMAELLLEDRAEARAEALAHLEFATAEFREMKMGPALGRAIRLAQVAERQPAAPGPEAHGYPDRLSRREVDVLRLIVAGYSNREIAERLVISRHTVIRHVSNLLAKTGTINRTEATSYAHRHGLV